MKKRSAFFAVALAAVLAVGTPATAGQLVAVTVDIVKSNPDGLCDPRFGGRKAETGTQEFRDVLRAAMEFAADFRDRGCGIARISVTPI